VGLDFLLWNTPEEDSPYFLSGMTDIQVDMDCKVRFNCFSLRDYFIKEKGDGWK